RKAASETVGELAHGWSTLLLHRLACARNGPDTQRLSERATEARSQPWRPWRAYAVLHLWHLSGTFVGEPT
ncbi:hypothetical protein BMR86_14895, partial [Stenotrophomonas sp. KAs 5-3]